jgi:hypothetical protein
METQEDQNSAKTCHTFILKIVKIDKEVEMKGSLG